MMNLILSIFLCLAMALGGAAELPAEPESATTWTLRNVAVEADGEEYLLAPEARLTAAIGENRATARFAVQSGEKELLPVAAEVSKDALRLSFGAGERVYELSEASLMQRVEDMSFMEVSPELLDAAGDLFLSYGRMLGALSDPEAAQEYSAAVLQALINTCAAGTEPAQVELDGATLEGQRISLRIAPQNIAPLFDALRETGIPGLNDYLQALLAIGNLADGTNYQSLSERFANADVGNFALPMTITAAQGDGVSCVKEELNFSQDGMAMAASVEAVTRDTHTEEALTLSLQTPDGTSAQCDFSGTFTGPAAAHDGMNGQFDFTVTQPDGEYARTAILRMTMDADTSDGLGGGSVSWDFTASEDGETSGSDAHARFSVDWAGRREDDGSATWAVEIAGGDEGAAKLRFELNRAAGAFESPFEDMETFEIDPELLGDAEPGAEDMMLLSALGLDASQMALDASQLAAEPSVKALVEHFEQSCEAEDDYDYGEVDYALRDVATLEEAAEIYQGDIPDYAPPAGWERTELSASPSYLRQVFENPETGKSFVLGAADFMNPWYAYTGGELAIAEDPIVTVMSYDGSINSATVSTSGPDGQPLFFYLDGQFSLDEFEELLSGLS